MNEHRAGMHRGRGQRLSEIVRLLHSGVTRVEDLSVAVAVSESTVRRDLASLEAEGVIARTYGGAQPFAPFRETRLQERMTLEVAAKTRIGAAAAELVEDGATIFVDAGSTTSHLVENLRTRTDLTVLTRGIEIALALANSPIEVIVVGGAVSPSSHGLTGSVTQLVLERFAVDIAFLGCDAVHPDRGVGEPTIEEAATKEVAARNARRTVVLAHAAKLTPGAVPAWAPLPPGWTLITDESSEARLQPFREAGVDVVPVAAGRTEE
ncbi:DeoR/GlpR family DNA-binding transcription regulator [Janibacter cremeus]|uniref:DeoR/GlpR family DNA-binding transcription regulator n=1 Tax=Janibacter cremeus TaxID=1285192 RepID=UPI0023F7CEB3|nr:DeoR/GlpR family DNA-binding transcription regulator [Janibacter cremeus]WEV78761.1 DeoR/GlpR family DNA-binding transcription regulator [Janibacter cremeus]